jgi:hypothetical protein
MAKNRLPRLQPDVALKYRATIVPTRIEFPHLGRTIDMTKLTVAEADELVKDPKFTYLELRRQRRKKAA